MLVLDHAVKRRQPPGGRCQGKTRYDGTGLGVGMMRPSYVRINAGVWATALVVLRETDQTYG